MTLTIISVCMKGELGRGKYLECPCRMNTLTVAVERDPVQTLVFFRRNPAFSLASMVEIEQNYIKQAQTLAFILEIDQ